MFYQQMHKIYKTHWRHLTSYVNSSIIQPSYSIIVDVSAFSYDCHKPLKKSMTIVEVSATDAVFFGTNVRQVSLRQTVSNHRCVKGDRQKKQQDKQMDRGSDMHQKRTKRVDEQTRGVLSTSTHLWLLTVRRSDTWQTVVLKNAAAIAKTSTIITNLLKSLWQ